MKLKLTFLMALFFTFYLGKAQISLSKGFRCVSMSQESNMRDSYFSDGIFRFHSEAWGREVDEPGQLKDFVQKMYGNNLIFKKTTDNLYWATGISNNEYKYVIIIPSKLTTVALSSKTSNTQFSNYSAWILQQVRINISSGKDFYFTNFRGQECN